MMNLWLDFYFPIVLYVKLSMCVYQLRLCMHVETNFIQFVPYNNVYFKSKLVQFAGILCNNKLNNILCFAVINISACIFTHQIVLLDLEKTFRFSTSD